MLAVEITDTSEPLGTEANWTLGADMDCSSKPVLAMASSSSVAGRATVAQAAQVAKAPAQQSVRSAFAKKRLGVKVVIGNTWRLSTYDRLASSEIPSPFIFSIFVIIECMLNIHFRATPADKSLPACGLPMQ
jgi:hypothetical protein